MNKGLILAELGRYEDAIAAADKSICLADEEADVAMLHLIRAKILSLAERHTLAAEGMISAWRMDAGRLVSLRESRELFIDIYGRLDTPSEEQSLMFAEVSWNEAAAAMDDDEPSKAVFHSKNAAQAYDRVVGVPSAADEILERTSLRFAVYRHLEFAQPMFSRMAMRNSATGA